MLPLLLAFVACDGAVLVPSGASTTGAPPGPSREHLEATAFCAAAW